MLVLILGFLFVSLVGAVVEDRLQKTKKPRKNLWS